MKKYLVKQLLNIFQINYHKNIQSYANLHRLLLMTESQLLRLIIIYSNI